MIKHFSRLWVNWFSLFHRTQSTSRTEITTLEFAHFGWSQRFSLKLQIQVFAFFYLKYSLYKFLFWYIKVVWRKSQRVPTEPKKRERSSYHRCHCNRTKILQNQTFYPFSYTHQALQQPIQIYSLTHDPLESRRFWTFNWFANFQEHLSSLENIWPRRNIHISLELVKKNSLRSTRWS